MNHQLAVTNCVNFQGNAVPVALSSGPQIQGSAYYLGQRVVRPYIIDPAINAFKFCDNILNRIVNFIPGAAAQVVHATPPKLSYQRLDVRELISDLDADWEALSYHHNLASKRHDPEREALLEVADDYLKVYHERREQLLKVKYVGVEYLPSSLAKIASIAQDEINYARVLMRTDRLPSEAELETLRPEYIGERDWEFHRGVIYEDYLYQLLFDLSIDLDRCRETPSKSELESLELFKKTTIKILRESKALNLKVEQIGPRQKALFSTLRRVVGIFYQYRCVPPGDRWSNYGDITLMEFYNRLLRQIPNPSKAMNCEYSLSDDQVENIVKLRAMIEHAKQQLKLSYDRPVRDLSELDKETLSECYSAMRRVAQFGCSTESDSEGIINFNGPASFPWTFNKNLTDLKQLF